MQTFFMIKMATQRGVGLLMAGLILFSFIMVTAVSPVAAQAVLFDFDNAPLHTSLPISQTAGGITAHFAATGDGYSIQDNSAPVVPAGFSGRFVYPNSVFLADLLIRFDQTLTDFSIQYACQELGCDDAATMRVTAYLNGIQAGTNTRTATIPGTWPVDTLSCTFTQGFDSVVVHYDHRPPTCQDYGVIFIADNMRVTARTINGIANPQPFIDRIIIPNPVSSFSSVSFHLLKTERVSIAMYDLSGRLISNVYNGSLGSGEHKLNIDIADTGVEGGIYFLLLTGEHFTESHKLAVVK